MGPPVPVTTHGTGKGAHNTPVSMDNSSTSKDLAPLAVEKRSQSYMRYPRFSDCSISEKSGMLGSTSASLDIEAQWERYTTAANAPGNPFQGLRVRMGIHKGDAEVIKYPTRARQMYKGAAVQVAKAVSNAASGGQILMSGDVMAAVDIRHGCPKENENNESQSRVTAVKPFSRDTLSRRNVREKG
eukprot:1196184-Prorocentrum_minimum.AAC.6